MRPILRSEAATAVGGLISISNLNQLQLMGANLGASYRLSGTIDATATNASNPSDIWGAGGFVPVGTGVAEFTGSLDGAGYTINGLTIYRPTTDYVGLIGIGGKTVRNLGLVGGSVTGRGYVGALVGDWSGSATAVYATGPVTGSGNYVGGLMGYTRGGSTLTNTYATGNVTGTNKTKYFVGGLVGYAMTSTITNAYATGAVAAEFWVGGLVGSTRGGSISQSYATGAVTGNQSIGGLVGNGDGTIDKSYATGAVSGFATIGGLVGYSYSTISQSYATGAVSGRGAPVGGLVGNNSGTIYQSYATGTVKGGSSTGGLVGTSYYGIITRSYASGAVTGNGDVGGLVGRTYFGGISQSYATGAVNGANGVGGLVGWNQAAIVESYASGAVTATGIYVGGLLGVGLSEGSITRSYATGAVTGARWWVGGLVGSNAGSISQAYASGRVTSQIGDMAKSGGLVGQNHGATITQSYWDKDTTRQSRGVGTDSATPAGLFGLTQAQARTRSSYVGWDKFFWYQAGDMRPILRSEAAPAVNGVISISNLHQLQLMGANLSASYKLTGNIDAAPTNGNYASDIWGSGGFVPVGAANVNFPSDPSPRFNGRFDGAGYTINALTINRPTTDYVGLFGYLGTAASVSRLGLVGGAVTGRNYVGALAGYNAGTISQSYASSVVTGLSYVGALAGYNAGTISQSYWDTTTKGPSNGVGSGSATGVTGLTKVQMQDASR